MQVRSHSFPNRSAEKLLAACQAFLIFDSLYVVNVGIVQADGLRYYEVPCHDIPAPDSATQHAL